MGLEANVVYLDEEIKNLHERIAMIRSFIQANPSASEKVLRAKVQLAHLKIEILALKRQSKIARMALKQIRAYDLKKSRSIGRIKN